MSTMMQRNWTDLIKNEMEEAYRATEGLMDLVDADKLDWQPETGERRHRVVSPPR